MHDNDSKFPVPSVWGIPILVTGLPDAFAKVQASYLSSGQCRPTSPTASLLDLLRPGESRIGHSATGWAMHIRRRCPLTTPATRTELSGNHLDQDRLKQHMPSLYPTLQLSASIMIDQYIQHLSQLFVSQNAVQLAEAIPLDFSHPLWSALKRTLASVRQSVQPSPHPADPDRYH